MHSLIIMYADFGRICGACRLFEEMPSTDGISYNFLIRCFGFNGFHEKVVHVFDEMVGLGFVPNFESVFHAIMASGELRNLEKGVLVHDISFRIGLTSNLCIGNSLISMYNKIGRLDLGHQIFQDMPEKDLVSWNSMITGYAQNGDWTQVFELFVCMKKMCYLVPSRVTYLGLLLACGHAQNLDMGMSIHGRLVHLGLVSDFRLGTSMVDMYSKCGKVEFALVVFEDELTERSLISWNSLIAGYSQNGYDYEAVFLFQRMLRDSNVKPDAITIANVVPASASLSNLHMVQSIHSISIKKGLRLDTDIVLGTAMVDAYGKCLNVEAANLLFRCIGKFRPAVWNAMISGYNVNGQAHQGMKLFLEMLHDEVLPDSITMVMLFQSCGELGSLRQGSVIHGYCFSKGFSSHLMVCNAMIDMYLRCGCLKTSLMLFNSMPSKNIVTWNTVLCGNVKIGHSGLVLQLFHQLQWENKHRPDPVTMIAVIQACAIDSARHGCMIVHSLALRLGFDSEARVANSLIDAYSKNGFIDNAWSLFQQMGQSKDQSSWNVMVAGFGMNGQGEKACALLSQMEGDGYKPNSITFISLLSSCSHSGLIDEGWRYFKLMVTKYRISPSLEHWTCIIDMFGRAGRLEEAYQLIKNGYPEVSESGIISSDCAAIWGSLLSACRMNINVELGELASQQLSRLAPNNCGYHTLLSNLYASGNKWDEAAKIRRVFEDGHLMKKPGLSMIKI